MTLVLSCTTSDFGIQVSDKRLTSIQDGAVLDDARNKGIQYFAQMVFAYSGLAAIDGLPTDEWLAETLRGHDNLEDGLENARDRLTEEFARVGLPARAKRHAFVGVGWARLDDAEGIAPLVVTLTNALRTDGTWEDEAASSFSITCRSMARGERFRLFTLGAIVPDGLRRDAERNIHRAIHRGANPYAIIRILAHTIRSVASMDKTVGRTLLAMVVPKKGCDANALALCGAMWRPPTTIESPMFFHIPAQSDALDRTIPTGVGPGGFVALGGSVTFHHDGSG